jgi:hypothetical protein
MVGASAPASMQTPKVADKPERGLLRDIPIPVLTQRYTRNRRNRRNKRNRRNRYSAAARALVWRECDAFPFDRINLAIALTAQDRPDQHQLHWQRSKQIVNA